MRTPNPLQARKEIFPSLSCDFTKEMNYFNWQSDNNQIIVQKYVGSFTADFFELVDQHLFQFQKNPPQLLSLDDISETNLSELSIKDAEDLALSFLQNTVGIPRVKHALVIGSFERPEIALLVPYSRRLEVAKHIEYRPFEDVESALKWLDLGNGISLGIQEKLRAWEKSHSSRPS